MKLTKLFTLILISFGLYGCPGSDGPGNGPEYLALKGGKFAGGVFRLSEPQYVRSLYPPSIVDVYTYRTACQIYEGLLKFNPETLELENGIAKSVEFDEANNSYIIKLKKNVFFHDDVCFENGKGRNVVAKDVEYCFKQIATPSSINQSFHLVKGIVKGAEEFYQAAKDGKPLDKISGLEVVDEYTLKIEILSSAATFRYNLARQGLFIYPEEAWRKYHKDMSTHPVGTGPFMLKDPTALEEQKAIVLLRNPKYHKEDEFGNKLPFLKSIYITHEAEKKLEYMNFKNKKLEMVYRIPASKLTEMIEEGADIKSSNVPELSTQLLLLNNQDKLFNDINLRKAFSFAINRELLFEFTIDGEGHEPGNHGVTPPVSVFDENYHVKQIRGYQFNEDSAKYYLKKAGYSSGDEFPEIKFFYNAEGERHTNVAIELKNQLKQHLGIEISLELTQHSKIIDYSKKGNYQMTRIAWIADYPSPENFLSMFYGKDVPNVNTQQTSFPNIARYKSEEFDKLYKKGVDAVDPKESYQYFMLAEQHLMNSAPVIVLWYDAGYRIIQSYVKGFPSNPLEYRDFSYVYFDYDKIEKDKNAKKD